MSKQSEKKSGIDDGSKSKLVKENAKIIESKEISDDELKDVSGGYSSSDGTVGSGCIIS